MKSKNIKVKDNEINISFFDKSDEIIKDEIVGDFDKKQEDKKEDINKKIDILTDDIKNREEVKEKILLPQKNINRNYKNAKNKLKNKIEEYNAYLGFIVNILTINDIKMDNFYSFMNNEYKNNRAKIFSIPKNFFKINLYENTMIWLFILIPPLLYMSYRKVKGIKIPFYFFMFLWNCFLQLLIWYFGQIS